MVYIPLDVVEAILLELSIPSDRLSMDANAGQRHDTLSSCRLVCRGWKPLATRFLFRAINYSFHYQYPAELEVQSRRDVIQYETVPKDSSLNVPSKTLHTLHVFLQENSASCAHIKNLRLEGYLRRPSHPGPRGRKGRVGGARTVAALTLVALVNMLPNLQTLDLTDVAVEDTDALPKTIHRLDSLHIRYATDAVFNIHHLAQLLTCFGAIGAATLLFPYNAPQVVGSGDHIVHLRPHTLTIGDPRISTPEFLVSLFAHAAVRSSIRDLRLLPARPDFLINTVPFLRTLGGTLEALRLTVHYVEPPKDVDLSYLTALRCLAFQIESLDPTEPSRCVETLGYVAHILDTCGITPHTSPSLSSLVLHMSFELKVPGSPTPKPAELTKDARMQLANNALDAKLVSVGKQFNISHVMIQYAVQEGEVGHGCAENTIEAMFPVLRGKGVLRVSYGIGS